MKRFAAVLLFAGALSVPFVAQAGASAKSSLRAAHTSVSSSGGPVAIRAHLAKTSGRCAWSVNPKIKGFADKVKCRSSMARVLHVPASDSTARETFRVSLRRQSKPRTVVSLRITRKGEAVQTVSAPAPVTTIPPITTAAAPVVALAASIDPSYVQSSTDPYEVTWTYSASAQETSDGITQDDSSLPDGVLELFSDGSLVQSSDVGGSVSSAQSTITYSSWGDHSVDVVYDSGTSSGTTGAEAFDIEPPSPSPMMETWGTTTPSNGALISATVSADETSDDVTLTDPNFEGAQSVSLTDDNGNACTATVSGTTAECTMDNTATPTSFVVGYPGGTTTTQTIDPYGVDQSQSVEWPSDQVTISDPSVTAPSTTDVTDTIPDIDAYAVLGGGDCGTTPNPENYECFEMGVEWAGTDSPPTGGTVTLTATAENETSGNEDTASCTVDLSSATTCYVLYDSEPGIPNLTAGNWSIAATYSGFDNDEYAATNWAAITTPVDYTMTYAYGSWYDYQGSGS